MIKAIWNWSLAFGIGITVILAGLLLTYGMGRMVAWVLGVDIDSEKFFSVAWVGFMVSIALAAITLIGALIGRHVFGLF